MSFASKVLYTGDGVTTDFNVPMPYISRTHVNAYVNEILQLTSMNYVWSGPSTISFGTAPNSGDAIEIRRWTSPTATLVDFVNGSVLNESDLDTAYLHSFYLSQEYADSFNEVINAMLLRVATAQGIESTEPDQVILELVADMINSAASANLQARISDIDDNAEAIITLGDSLQVQLNTLASGVSADVYIVAAEPVAGVGGVPNPILEGSRWYDSDDNNTPYIYQSSAWVSIEDPRIGDAAASITVLVADFLNMASAIVHEQFVRSTETTAFAQEMGLIGAQNGDQSAFIVDLDTAFVGPTESLASRFSTITASWVAADVQAVADAAAAAVAYTDAEISTEQTARANADTAIASDITTLDARVVIAEAAVVTNAAQIVTDRGVAASATSTVASDVTTLTARVGVTETDSLANAAQIITDRTAAASATSAVASDVTTLTSEVDSNTATVSTHATSINGIEAEYGVDLTSNGYIQGFRIINGGTPGANAFVVLADKFAVVDPSGDAGETTYVPFEISDGKINMRSDVTIDGDLIVGGTINGTALELGTIGATQIGTDAITTIHVGADQITADEIRAGAITAEKINVTNLAAIEADLGSITAGNITLDTSGYIKGGQTAYDTGTGFFLGYAGGQYKFSLGSPTGNHIKWDGSQLTIFGDVEVGEYGPSDTVLLSADTQVSATFGDAWHKEKEFSIDKAGTLRVSAEGRRTSSGGATPQWRIKTDGIVRATFDVTTQSVVEESADVPVTRGGNVEIELNFQNSVGTLRVTNARVKGEVIIPATGGSVVLD